MGRVGSVVAARNAVGAAYPTVVKPGDMPPDPASRRGTVLPPKRKNNTIATMMNTARAIELRSALRLTPLGFGDDIR